MHMDASCKHGMKKAHAHGAHDHAHDHTHEHGHEHSHAHSSVQHGESVLVLRPSTGIAGDMLVAGLAGLSGADQALLDAMTADIGMPELASGSFAVREHFVSAVGGLQGNVTLPHEHAHRSFTDIKKIIEASGMEKEARELALNAFARIAEAEGAVHGKTAASVTFHEVGALDSILDICLASSLFTRLAPARFICGPLPVCDGEIRCAHGEIPSPAPAVLRLLHGIPVHGLPCKGETVTPTGLALLLAFGAEFGPWPAMVLEREVIAYGHRVFPGVPNGAIFAFGKAC